MNNHTPGPWNVSPVSCDVWGHGGYLICEVCPTFFVTDEKKANARLIAAAPELLDALETVMKYWAPDVCRKSEIEAVGLAKAAISKAKGIP